MQSYWLPSTLMESCSAVPRCGRSRGPVFAEHRSKALAVYRDRLEPLHEELSALVSADMLTHHVGQLIFIAQGRRLA